MKKYNCYSCGSFLKIHTITRDEIKDDEDEHFVGSVNLVCNNKKCPDYGKHHVDNFIDED